MGMLFETIVMFAMQHRKATEGIANLLVLLIGGIPIAMPTVLSVTMAIGSHRLSQQVCTIFSLRHGHSNYFPVMVLDNEEFLRTQI